MQLAGQSAKKALQALRSSHLRNNLTSSTLNLQIFWHQKSSPQFPVHYIYIGIYFTFLQEIVKIRNNVLKKHHTLFKKLKYSSNCSFFHMVVLFN